MLLKDLDWQEGDTGADHRKAMFLDSQGREYIVFEWLVNGATWDREGAWDVLGQVPGTTNWEYLNAVQAQCIVHKLTTEGK